MRKLLIVIITILLGMPLFSANPKNGEHMELVVFLAASSTGLMEDISILYQEETGIKLLLNPASSGSLAKQITSGAEADIFISASVDWIEYLKKDLVSSSSFVSNDLVIITRSDSSYEDFTLDFKGKLVMGDPDHVPGGKYAKEALESLGWFSVLKDKFILASDIRAALKIVEIGEADFGIVFKTDQIASSKVRSVYTFPLNSHKPIYYYIGLVTKKQSARDFYSFMLSNPRAKKVYINHGFSVIEE